MQKGFSLVDDLSVVVAMVLRWCCSFSHWWTRMHPLKQILSLVDFVSLMVATPRTHAYALASMEDQQITKCCYWDIRLSNFWTIL
jgi:hypothetical protein